LTLAKILNNERKTLGFETPFRRRKILTLEDNLTARICQYINKGEKKREKRKEEIVALGTSLRSAKEGVIIVAFVKIGNFVLQASEKGKKRGF